MKKQNEKRICKPLRIPEHVVKEIESEAKKKGTTFSHVAIERLQHDYSGIIALRLRDRLKAFIFSHCSYSSF